MTKILALIIFIVVSIKGFAQLSEVEFYPNDSLKKMAVSFNNNTIYCLGFYGDGYYTNQYELFKSTNKGLNWSLVNQFEDQIITSNFVSFSDSVHISASKHRIVKTNNAFDTIKCIICNNIYPTSIEAVNQDTILIYDRGITLLSYDGFVTWDTVVINTVADKSEMSIDEICIINDSTWIANVRHNCTLIKTNNAGANWHILKDFSAYAFCNNYIYSSFYTENEGVLFIKGSFYITHDGAQTFNKIFEVNEYIFEDMKFFASGWSYILTSHTHDSINIIYYSNNFGTSWDSLIYDYTYGRLLDIRFFSDTLMFINTYEWNLLKIDMTTVGKNEILKPASFVNIYPNPSAEYLNIETAGSTYWEYKIIDQLGKVVISGLKTGERAEVNLGLINKGLYYIQVTDLITKLAIVKKLIKI